MPNSCCIMYNFKSITNFRNQCCLRFVLFAKKIYYLFFVQEKQMENEQSWIKPFSLVPVLSHRTEIIEKN